MLYSYDTMVLDNFFSMVQSRVVWLLSYGLRCTAAVFPIFNLYKPRPEIFDTVELEEMFKYIRFRNFVVIIALILLHLQQYTALVPLLFAASADCNECLGRCT